MSKVAGPTATGNNEMGGGWREVEFQVECIRLIVRERIRLVMK